MIPRKPDRPCHPAVRGLALIFFALGLPWALIAWVAIVGGPARAIEDLSVALGQHDPARIRGAIVQIPLLLGCSAQAIWGYLVWGGWLRVAAGRMASTRRFWLLAAVQHLIWIGLLAADWSTSPLTLGMMMHSVAVGSICLVVGLASGLSFSRPKPSHDDWPALA